MTDASEIESLTKAEDVGFVKPTFVLRGLLDLGFDPKNG